MHERHRKGEHTWRNALHRQLLALLQSLDGVAVEAHIQTFNISKDDFINIFHRWVVVVENGQGVVTDSQQLAQSREISRGNGG